MVRGEGIEHKSEETAPSRSERLEIIQEARQSYGTDSVSQRKSFLSGMNHIQTFEV